MSYFWCRNAGLFHCTLFVGDGTCLLHVFLCIIVKVLVFSGLSFYDYWRECDESPRKVHEKGESGLSVDFLIIFFENYQIWGLFVRLGIDSEIDAYIVLHSFEWKSTESPRRGLLWTCIYLLIVRICSLAIN